MEAPINPPAMDADTGIALDKPKGLPLNHRLRAEALVSDGKTTDEAGVITDDLIADTAQRLASEAKAAADAEAKAKKSSERKAAPEVKES